MKSQARDRDSLSRESMFPQKCLYWSVKNFVSFSELPFSSTPLFSVFWEDMLKKSIIKWHFFLTNKWTRANCWSAKLLLGSSVSYVSKLIQVIERIWFLEVVGLKSLFSHYLSAWDNFSPSAICIPWTIVPSIIKGTSSLSHASNISNSPPLPYHFGLLFF